MEVHKMSFSMAELLLIVGISLVSLLALYALFPKRTQGGTSTNDADTETVSTAKQSSFSFVYWIITLIAVSLFAGAYYYVYILSGIGDVEFLGKNMAITEIFDQDEVFYIFILSLLVSFVFYGDSRILTTFIVTFVFLCGYGLYKVISAEEAETPRAYIPPSITLNLTKAKLDASLREPQVGIVQKVPHGKYKITCKGMLRSPTTLGTIVNIPCTGFNNSNIPRKSYNQLPIKDGRYGGGLAWRTPTSNWLKISKYNIFTGDEIRFTINTPQTKQEFNYLEGKFMIEFQKLN